MGGVNQSKTVDVESNETRGRYRLGVLVYRTFTSCYRECAERATLQLRFRAGRLRFFARTVLDFRARFDFALSFRLAFAFLRFAFFFDLG